MNLKNLEISKRLSAARLRLNGMEDHGIREACRAYANLLVEARPGRYVRREAIELLKRAEAAK